MRVPIEKVPIDVRRRAANHLESLARQGIHKQARDATLGRQATPVERPDVDGVAYWEIEVEGVKTVAPIEGDTTSADQGFILVSTGGHDVPIPHFSLTLAPPSRQLEARGEIARVVKLDALCYVGLDTRGELTSQLGSLPPRLVGVPKAGTKPIPGWGTTVPKQAPLAADNSDEAPPKLRPRVSRETRPVTFGEPWKGYEELAENYARTFGPYLSALAERAKHPWEIDHLAAQFGDVIGEGETVTVRMLAAGEVALDGPAAHLVGIDRDGREPATVFVTAGSPTSLEEVDLTLVFSYADGSVEKLPYAILPAWAPSPIPAAFSPLGPALSNAFGGGRR